jgi:TatD DNase family protein
MDLFDSHCHLQDDRLSGRCGRVLARAAKAGIAHMVCCGTRPSDWGQVAALAGNYAGIIPAYGIHPWYVADASDLTWEHRLRELLELNPRAGVGEIGLDAAVRPRRTAEQQSLFVQQLNIAREFERPVSIHCRRAWDALRDALETVGEMPGGMVIHSFSGSPELVESLVRFGVYFSFSGSITNPDYARAEGLVRAVPQDRLLIETDAPDMLPHGGLDRAALNEPANLHVVAEKIAAFTGLSLETVAALTTRNACRLFL